MFNYSINIWIIVYIQLISEKFHTHCFIMHYIESKYITNQCHLVGYNNLMEILTTQLCLAWWQLKPNVLVSFWSIFTG